MIETVLQLAHIASVCEARGHRLSEWVVPIQDDPLLAVSTCQQCKVMLEVHWSSVTGFLFVGNLYDTECPADHFVTMQLDPIGVLFAWNGAQQITAVDRTHYQDEDENPPRWIIDDPLLAAQLLRTLTYEQRWLCEHGWPITTNRITEEDLNHVSEHQKRVRGALETPTPGSRRYLGRVDRPPNDSPTPVIYRDRRRRIGTFRPDDKG